jgi:hypothetical protein
LNRKGNSGHPCLVPDFRGNVFSFSPVSMMFALGLSCIAFTMLRYFHSIPTFLRAFIMNWCWILLKDFTASIDQVVFVLSFINVLYCIYRFTYVHPQDEAYWSWWMIFLMCCRICFAIILLIIFASMFIKEICQ